jgi:hypothetical protein
MNLSLIINATDMVAVAIQVMGLRPTRRAGAQVLPQGENS